MNITRTIAAFITLTFINLNAKNNKPLFDIESICAKYNISKNVATKSLNFAQRSMIAEGKLVNVIDDGVDSLLQVTRHGVGILETKHGNFYLFDFNVNDAWKSYLVLVKAELDDNFMPKFKNQNNITLRVDSGCLTGQLLGDQTCECKEQLDEAIKIISQIGEGIIICIPHQDGRGMGLDFKLGTLILQHELGINTVESANLLAQSSKIDTRTYSGAIGILKFLGITEKTKISIATNNPKKLTPFILNGYSIEKTVPLVIEPNEHTREHLQAKKMYLNHTL